MAEAYGATTKLLKLGSRGPGTPGPKAPMDAHAIRNAYRRWAGKYDLAFGAISMEARKEAVAAVNATSGPNVLEVGVGTGLALPLYAANKRITGIDLSAPMLELARERVVDAGLRNIDALLEMDAQATSFTDGQFDVAVAMFVASVVPNPKVLFAELRRVVRPGGRIFFVNHFAVERGPVWWVERALAPASAVLGWHPDFRMGHMFTEPDLMSATVKRMSPFGLFRLVAIHN